MTLELIIFIASILFGALLYWKESNGNGLYRFFNKLMNSKELRMKPKDKTGFVYQQKFFIRLVFIGLLFLIGIVVTRFLIPIDLATISIFTSMIIGTLVGTYLANFIFKSSEVIDEQSESIEDKIHNTFEKGKDFIEDLKVKNANVVDETNENPEAEPEPEKKSARERLKDKGLM
ncbi:MAG: hypothetical protein KDC68_04700 [Gelidibacter sp.]|nr:hypothetical protein [Gelidibacter sp.]